MFVGAVVFATGFNPTVPRFMFVGDTAVFECNIGTMIPDGSIVDWSTRSGLPLPMDRIVYADRNTTLIITDLLPSDRDSYVCRVIQPDGGRGILIYDLILNGTYTNVKLICVEPRQ